MKKRCTTLIALLSLETCVFACCATKSRLFRHAPTPLEILRYQADTLKNAGRSASVLPPPDWSSSAMFSDGVNGRSDDAV